MEEAKTLYELLLEKAGSGGSTAKSLLSLLEEHYPGDVKKQMILLYFIYKIRWAMSSDSQPSIKELIQASKKYGVYNSLQTILESISGYGGVF